MRGRRSNIVWSLATGLLLTGLAVGSAVADDGPGHKKDAKHDHDQMKVEKKIADALKKLSSADQKLATAQRFCPMMAYSRLGADGAPLRLTLAGKPVFVCCKGCVKGAEKGGKDTLAKAAKLTKASAVLAKLPAKDRAAAEAQKYCAIMKGSFLGAMGAPIKLDLNGKPAFVCCKGCTAKAKANPATTLAQVEKLKKAGEHGGHHGDHDHGDHKHGDKKTKK